MLRVESKWVESGGSKESSGWDPVDQKNLPGGTRWNNKPGNPVEVDQKNLPGGIR